MYATRAGEMQKYIIPTSADAYKVPADDEAYKILQRILKSPLNDPYTVFELYQQLYSVFDSAECPIDEKHKFTIIPISSRLGEGLMISCAGNVRARLFEDKYKEEIHVRFYELHPNKKVLEAEIDESMIGKIKRVNDPNLEFCVKGFNK